MNEFTDRVQRGLKELRARDPQGERVFGASTHRYELHAPLNEGQLARFEKKHGIRLPADYRAFLKEAGNGGAGPFYGIFKLGEMDDDFGHKRWKTGETVGDPAMPFPHKKAWNLSEDELERIQESEDDDEILRVYWVPVNGAVPICHEGCALRNWLVVTGPEAGHVWHDATSDFAGWSPFTLRNGRHMTFEDWYSSWLKKALAETGR